MNRVVVTGLGIISSIGAGVPEVLTRLRESRSGMVHLPEMTALGYGCSVYAPAPLPELGRLPPPLARCMSPAAAYALGAALEAVHDAGLSEDELVGPRVGTVIGNGHVPRDCTEATKLAVPDNPLRVLVSLPATFVAGYFELEGRVASLSASCATGLYNIGLAYELLQRDTLDVCICGSAQEDTWEVVGLSADNSNGMSAAWNDRPSLACRPYDRDRQGFIMSAGSGILVLETLEHARRRHARCYAEVLGYGAANDGQDMFLSSGDGLRLSIEDALRSTRVLGLGDIDYINSHGTGTLSGDPIEVRVLRELFGAGPRVSSTKGLCGHAQGATAAQEAVFTVLMLYHGFVAPTVNLENVAPDCEGIRHVQRLEHAPLATAMTINTGLGGTNACLVLGRAPSGFPDL